MNIKQLDKATVGPDDVVLENGGLHTDQGFLCGEILGYAQSITKPNMDFITAAANGVTRIKEILSDE